MERKYRGPEEMQGEEGRTGPLEAGAEQKWRRATSLIPFAAIRRLHHGIAARPCRLSPPVSINISHSPLARRLATLYIASPLAIPLAILALGAAIPPATLSAATQRKLNSPSNAIRASFPSSPAISAPALHPECPMRLAMPVLV
ncbi:hypothetical protein DFH09DRAFT_1317711 [Mycena vulgaris]|nr:hypothetical protein DFH09DRAFT_1317711 [Mycena vulgaris]